jgi:hypothetical protein
LIAILLAVVAGALQKEQDRVEAARQASEQAARDEAAAAERRHNERRRLFGYAALPLAASGWSPVSPTGDDTSSSHELAAEDLRRNAKDWRQLADDLDQILQARPDEGASSESLNQAGFQAFVVLEGLSNRLQTYLLEGGRTRRLMYLKWLADDLASAAAAGWDWSTAAYQFRNAAVGLLGGAQHTDATIVERLLVERATRLFYPPPRPNKWRNLDLSEFPHSAASTDPLYLLAFILNTSCAQIKNEQDWQAANELLDLVGRPLGALRNELRAAATCSEALLAVVIDAETSTP